MRRRRFAALLCLLCLLIPCMSAQSVEPLRVVSFYMPYCEACRDADALLATLRATLAGKNPSPVWETHNVADADGLALFLSYCDAYDVPETQRTAPLTFVGDEALRLADLREALAPLATRILADDMPPTRTPHAGDTAPFQTLTALKVAGAGLVAGINPCALSMMLFFISFALSSKRRILPGGLAFLLGKAIAYVLLGTVLYAALRTQPLGAGWMRGMNLLLCTLSAGLALCYVRDAYAARHAQYGDIRMQLPTGLRARLIAYIRRMVEGPSGAWLHTGTALWLGMAVSVGEFLCTGQLLLATILSTLQSRTMQSRTAFLYLLLYTGCFLLPMLLLVLTLDRTRQVLRLSESIRVHMPLIKGLTALVFLAFAVFFGVNAL